MSAQPTLDWNATALFRLGEDAQARERYGDASRYYDEVLEHVPDFEPACFNRGVTELRRGHARHAAGLFEVLLGDKVHDQRLESRELPIAFNLALARACAGELDPALKAARAVLRCVLQTHAPEDRESPLPRRIEGAPKDRESPLRRRIEGPALALFAVVAARRSGLRPFPAPPRETPSRDELAELVRSEKVAEPYTAALAADLAREQLEEPRTQYLLACYECLGESPEFALDDLEDALAHDPWSIEWARRDPLLEPLRNADPREFRSLIRWARLGRDARPPTAPPG
jgi:tetratricopeptide (TPR) repeat protein